MVLKESHKHGPSKKLPKPKPPYRVSHIKLMKLVFEDSSPGSSSQTQDVFVYYHNDNYDWVDKILMPWLERKLRKMVKTKEDLVLGAFVIDEIIKRIHECEYLIVTLSDSFIGDNECRDFTIKAYDMHPHALVPLALPPLDETKIEKDVIFLPLVLTNGLIWWSNHSEEKRKKFWILLEKRLNGEEIIVMDWHNSQDIVREDGW